MPRNVRNFWVTEEAEGMASRPGFGPRSKEGGFVVEVRQRENGGGAGTAAVKVTGRATTAGGLVLEVEALGADGEYRTVYTRVTHRDAAGVSEVFADPAEAK